MGWKDGQGRRGVLTPRALGQGQPPMRQPGCEIWGGLGTHLSLLAPVGLSPAEPWAKSGLNPSVAGRVTGSEIELLSPFVKCRNRREGGIGIDTKQVPGIRIAGHPQTLPESGQSTLPLCKALPGAAAYWAEMQSDGEFFCCFVFKGDFIKSTELFLRIVRKISIL